MKILSAVDGSPHAESVTQMLCRIPFPTATEVVAVHVLEEIYDSAYGEHIGKHVREGLHDQRLEKANALLKSESDRLSSHFSTVREELLAGHAAHELTELAETEQADLITIGARGLNALERFLLGSTSENVVRHAPCSVLVSHRSKSDPPEDRQKLRFLVACDGSPSSNEAIETLTRLPLGDSAEITLLSVHSLVAAFRMDVLQKMSSEWGREEEQVKSALDNAARHLEAAGIHNVSAHVREADDVTSEILSVAENWNADIVMAGNTGKSAVDRFLLGSVSKRLSRHAPSGVWIVRSKTRTTS